MPSPTLTEHERKQHLDTTSGSWIAEQFGTDKRFGGVFANDMLKRPKKDVGYVLNLQNQDEPGSHWTCLYNGFYFDSYGTPPTQAISKFVTHYNTEMYQSFHQESCGYHAIYVLKRLFAGKDPYGEMIPERYRRNEDVLKAYFF